MPAVMRRMDARDLAELRGRHSEGHRMIVAKVSTGISTKADANAVLIFFEMRNGATISIAVEIEDIERFERTLSDRIKEALEGRELIMAKTAGAA